MKSGMTCCICGTGFEGEDILIYGCISCGKGFSSNTNRTKGLRKQLSEYVPNGLRQKLITKHRIPLDEAERAIRDTQGSKGYERYLWTSGFKRKATI